MRHFDVLILGNGVLGLSTAYALHLEDKNLKIGILGKRDRRGSGSMAAGAMLGCFGEVTQSTFESRYGLAKLDMAVKAAKLWPSWVNGLNEKLNVSQAVSIGKGTFVISNSKSGQLDDQNYSSILKALHTYHEPYQEIDPSEIPGINPITNYRPFRSLYLPNEGFIDVPCLFDTLDSFIEKTDNITFIEADEPLICVKAEKIDSIQLNTKEYFSAQQYLIAAGSYSQALIDQIASLKYRIPKILFGVGCSLLLKSSGHTFKHVVRSPNRAGACGAHIMPQSGDTLFMGATNNLRISESETPKARDIYYLLERAIEQFDQNLHKAALVTWQVGHRPVTVDTFPLIGKTSIENLWILTGTYRDGIHDSPLLASSIAKQMLGKPGLFENIFPPERFPIQTMSKQEAIREGVKQFVSAAYEHGIAIPHIGWESILAEIWQVKFTSTYESLEVDIGLPADLLIMLAQEPDYIPLFRKYYHSVAQKQQIKQFTEKNSFDELVVDLG